MDAQKTILNLKEGGKIKRKAIFVSLILMIVFAPLTTVANVAAETTSTPRLFLSAARHTATTLGETFMVEINIESVSNLKGFEFKLGYNTSMLDALEVFEGPFLKSFGATLPAKLEIDDTLGLVSVAVVLFDKTAAEGSGELAIVNFESKSTGESIFDLFDTKLADPEALPIDHYVTDGYSTDEFVDPPLTISQSEIDSAITKGMEWLAAQQNTDGSWGTYAQVAITGFAVLKFETHAISNDVDPFDSSYLYHDQVRSGLDYILAHAYLVLIEMQPAGNPDSDNDGFGVYFGFGYHQTYETGIAMAAIAASTHPEMVVALPGSQVNGRTYKEVLQDAVDFLAFGQNDAGSGQGGWGYSANAYGWSDNSNTGYAVLGLAYAEAGFQCTIPSFVKGELNLWINFIQNDVNGDTNDGGSGYMDPENLVNILKTGVLLSEMAFVGDTKQTQRVIDAVDYIERHWNDPNADPGWKGDGIAHKQAMFTVMKGFEALGIETIIVDSAEVDWFDEMSRVLLEQQNSDGSWAHDYWGDAILGTEWALLTLQKTMPPSPLLHDVAVTDVTPYKTLVGQGRSLLVNVIVENQGNFTETFNVTLYHGYYPPLPPTPEQWETFWHMGDTNRDGYINMIDVNVILAAMFSTPGSPKWNPKADIVTNGKIDIFDLVKCISNVGKDIWAYFSIGGEAIETQTVIDLPPWASITLVFTWNTAGFALGDYTIGAYAYPVLGEIDEADNNFVDGTVTICIPATIDIDPDTLNSASNGEWITAYIELPNGYDVADIDPSTVLLTYKEFQLSAETDPKYGFVTDPNSYLMDHDGDGIMERMVKFDRSVLRDYLGAIDLPAGEKFYKITLTVTGEVAETLFEGSDTITVIKK